MRFWPWRRRQIISSTSLVAEEEIAVIHFVLCQIADGSHARTKAILGDIVEVAMAEDSVVDWMSGSLVTIAFGIPPRLEKRSQVEIEQSQLRLIQTILSRFGSEVRLIHGHHEGVVGAMGTTRRFSYTAWTPNFGQALEKLISLPFGSAAELKS